MSIEASAITHQRIHRLTPGGLALVEVIFASAVFFIIALLVLNLLPMSMMSVSQTEARLGANSLAGDRLIEATSGSFAALATGTQVYEQEINGRKYGIEETVYEIPDTDPSIIKGFKVVVSWRDGEQKREVAHETYVSAIRR